MSAHWSQLYQSLYITVPAIINFQVYAYVGIGCNVPCNMTQMIWQGRMHATSEVLQVPVKKVMGQGTSVQQ